MIVLKDGFEFFGDAKGEADVFIYEPNNQKKCYEYIIRNIIKKIALCGEGDRTKDYYDSIKGLDWIEYLSHCNGDYDFSFVNNLPHLKTFIGSLKFTLDNPSVQSFSGDYFSKGKISKNCTGLKEIHIWKLPDFNSLFEENFFPPQIKEIQMIGYKSTDLNNSFSNSSLKKIEFALSRNLESLKGIENFSALETILLYSCKRLKNLSDINNLKNIQSIRIYNCPSIDFKTIENLMDKVLIVK